MALKVELKPGERIIIGESLVTNAEGRTVLLIGGDAPILREKDIMTPETANTPARRICLCIQMMYLEKDMPKYQDIFIELVKELINAAPSFVPKMEKISNYVLRGMMYKALKEAKGLLAQEEELLKHV